MRQLFPISKRNPERIRQHRSRRGPVAFLAALSVLSAAPAAQAQSGGLGAWQNPDIGFIYDLKVDLHDAQHDAAGAREWTTRGFHLSTAEMAIGSEVDPYGRIDFNAQFSSTGAEIHELFFTLSALPGGMQLRGGQFLADFGRWNGFHTHFMPFISEPRILHEYFGGHLMPQGLELSWLSPLDHYFELTGGIYNGFAGHSHDSDPMDDSAAWGPDNPPPGCHFHGDDLHCPDNPAAEAAYLASLDDPLAPVAPSGNVRPQDLAFLGRARTSLELGLDWSIDLGASIIHQRAYRVSQRFPGIDHAKTTGGIDLAIFWNPPEQNLYRGLDFGLEYLRNQEEFEQQAAENWVQREESSDGFFSWIHYRASRRWEIGSYYENFAASRDSDDRRQRAAAFLSYNISHYQRVRCEYSNDDRGDFAGSVNQITLLYDGTIGFHTHGTQR
jgi:hypothetical protein